MLARIRHQYELFLLAVSFFSRLPVPATLPYSRERMSQSGRYFSLVGLLLGALCALIYTLLAPLFPAEVCVLLTMVASLLLTGAFHEDGLADMADGIGGGTTTERRLAIMKDSRLGSYGAVSLLMALLGKYVLLTQLAGTMSLTWVWLAGYSLSRAVAASFIYDLPYVADPQQSKSKSVAYSTSKKDCGLLMVVGVAPCLWFGMDVLAALLLFSLGFRVCFKRWLMARLGGFTGDCLGGAQQIMELGIYLLLLGFVHNGWQFSGVFG